MSEVKNMTDNEEVVSEQKKKSGKGKKVLIFILMIPVHLVCLIFKCIWEFIKALLSLVGIAFGNDSGVQAFKRGFSGDSAPVEEYTFTNSMGCSQTVYSSDGVNFYDANGSFVGKSDDGGKTIHTN